ncbi:MAG: hypothetical protein JW750_10610 [Anaerolineaceae bacterium]|nr:hypothetical protein [Anaerolineaceae bacterium]
MHNHSAVRRFHSHPAPDHLQLPKLKIAPVLATPGKPSVDLAQLQRILGDAAEILPPVAIQSPAHWAEVIAGLDESIDAILPLSIPAYPTEIWNEHPEPLVKRGLPLIFWCLIEHEEPDFWRFAARDMLQSLGVTVHIVNNNREGLMLVRALAMKRFIRRSKIVVFGEQNFPWNARSAGHIVTEKLGLSIRIRPIADFRAHYARITDAMIADVRAERLTERYRLGGVKPAELDQAIRTYLAIRAVLIEEQAVGFGVNCFGDLIIQGGRDVPCLAQLLLREEGYIAACDGDYIAMTTMALTSILLDKPCMTSNLYPVSYVGALTDHFGDPLSPPPAVARDEWHNMARLAHCGFVGVVSPEMTPEGRTTLQDWGGTYEIKRDGSGCGADGDLIADEEITVVSLGFNVTRLMATRGRVFETTHHPGMPHCETSALLVLNHLPEFFQNVSRDHVVVFYGDYLRDFEILAQILGLDFCNYA